MSTRLGEIRERRQKKRDRRVEAQSESTSSCCIFFFFFCIMNGNCQIVEDKRHAASRMKISVFLGLTGPSGGQGQRGL